MPDPFGRIAGVPPPFNMGVLRMFYRRMFSIPAGWTPGTDRRIIMHFDAVNWEAEVWVNGQRAGMHQGGWAAAASNCCHIA